MACLALLMVAGPCAYAAKTGVPRELSLTPAVVKQASDTTTIIKTKVVLAMPAPGYFICKLRCSETDAITFKDIIFAKGDTTGIGTATIDWSKIPEDASIKIFAFSVDAPDIKASSTLRVQKSTDDSP